MDFMLYIVILMIFLTTILADSNSPIFNTSKIIHEEIKTPAFRYGRYSQDYQRTLGQLTLDMFSGSKIPSIKMKKSVRSKKVRSTLTSDITNVTINDGIKYIDKEEKSNNVNSLSKEINQIENLSTQLEQLIDNKKELKETTIEAYKNKSNRVKRSSHNNDSAEKGKKENTDSQEEGHRSKKKYSKRYKPGFKYRNINGKKHKKNKAKINNKDTPNEKPSYVITSKIVPKIRKHKPKKLSRHGRHHGGTNKNNAGDEEIKNELYERIHQRNKYIDIKDVPMEYQAKRYSPAAHNELLKPEYYYENLHTTKKAESVIREKTKVLTQNSHRKKFKPNFKFYEITNGTINYVDDSNDHSADQDQSRSSEKLKYISKTSGEMDGREKIRGIGGESREIRESVENNKSENEDKDADEQDRERSQIRGIGKESHEHSDENDRSDNEDTVADEQDTERLQVPRRTYVEKREDSFEYPLSIHKNVDKNVPEHLQNKLLQPTVYLKKKILRIPTETFENEIELENDKPIVLHNDVKSENRSRYYTTSNSGKQSNRIHENEEREILSDKANQILLYKPVFNYNKQKYRTDEEITVPDINYGTVEEMTVPNIIYPPVESARNYKVVLENFAQKEIKPLLDKMLGDVHAGRPTTQAKITANKVKRRLVSVLQQQSGERMFPEQNYYVKRKTQPSKVIKIKVKRAKNSETMVRAVTEKLTILPDVGKKRRNAEPKKTKTYEVKENVFDIPDDRKIPGPAVPDYILWPNRNVVFPNKHNKKYVMPDYVIIPDRKFIVPNKHTNGGMPDEVMMAEDLTFPTKHVNIDTPALNETQSANSDHAIVNIVQNIRDYVTSIGLGAYNAIKNVLKDQGR